MAPLGIWNRNTGEHSGPYIAEGCSVTPGKTYTFWTYGSITEAHKPKGQNKYATEQPRYYATSMLRRGPTWPLYLWPHTPLKKPF